MNGALPYLWITTRRNALKRFFAGLLKAKSLGTTLFRLLLLGFLVFGLSRSSSYTDVSPAGAASLLSSYLAVVLILSVLGGFSERGIAFSPSQVDFLFAGPFSRRALVLHHLAGLYPTTWLAAVLPFAFFGVRAPNPGLGFLGAVLCQVTGIHLQLTGSILAIVVGERAWQRIRGPLKVFSTIAVIALLALLVSALTDAGGIRAVIAKAAASPGWRYLLYPAVAAGDLANARTLSEALPSLLGALAAAGVTLGVLLSLQVNFLEASIGASERFAAIRARIRSGKGLSALAPTKRPTAAARLPGLGIYRGAGAVLWKNAIVARRSGRRLYVSVALVLLIFFPAFLAGKSGMGAGLGATAILPFVLSSYFRFDFRGEGEQLAHLKTLPVSRVRLAAAEIAVPTAMALVLQAVLLALLVILDRIPAAWAPLALLACIPLTSGVFAVVNLAHFLGGKGAAAAAVLQTLFLMADLLLLGGIAWLLHALGLGWVSLIALLAAAQIAILVAVIALLGLAFSAHDVSGEVT